MTLGKGLYKISIISFLVILQFALIILNSSASIYCHNFSAKAGVRKRECVCCQNRLTVINLQKYPYRKKGCTCKNRKRPGEQIPAKLTQIFSNLEEISYAAMYVIPMLVHRENEWLKNFIRTYTPKSNKLDILRSIVMLN